MSRSKTNTLSGRDARVDICPRDAGFVVSIGRVSVWLEPSDAEDLFETLGQALIAALSKRADNETAAPRLAVRDDEPN